MSEKLLTTADIHSAKRAVALCALGVRTLDEPVLLEALEGLYWQGYSACLNAGGKTSDSRNNALAVQIGGEHYKTCKIQPVEFIEANTLGFLEGCVLKRITRHNRGGKGAQDIEKAIHELQLLLELRYSGDESN
jgi:hypothetical protein